MRKKLIDRNVIIAEIERKLQDLIVGKKDAVYAEERVISRAKIDMCKEILSFLNTIEVKEVDLEKEVDDYVNEYFSECDDGVLISDANSMELTLLDITPLAKHFFELGLKTKKGE